MEIKVATISDSGTTWHNINPEEEEGRTMTEHELEESYDDMLDDAYGTVDVAGMTYDTSRLLKNADPIAYRVGMADFADSLLQDDDTLTIEGYSN